MEHTIKVVGSLEVLAWDVDGSDFVLFLKKLRTVKHWKAGEMSSTHASHGLADWLVSTESTQERSGWPKWVAT
jgi:hypothetical protein